MLFPKFLDKICEASHRVANLTDIRSLSLIFTVFPYTAEVSNLLINEFNTHAIIEQFFLVKNAHGGT